MWPFLFAKPVYQNIYLLTPQQAAHLFLPEDNCEFLDKPSGKAERSIVNCEFAKQREAATARPITIGVNKVAEEPTDADFEQAAVYTITLPSHLLTSSPSHLLTSSPSPLLTITYRGDVARLYANGKLIDDNFYNGRPFQYGLWRLPEGCRELELRRLPLQKDMPVYFPREADTSPGEAVYSVTITQ